MNQPHITKDEQLGINKRHYYRRLLNSSYRDALNIIKTRHDVIIEPYFINGRKNTSIMRYRDLGLMIHHDLENEIPSLSSVDALQFGDKYQQPDVLTYVDVYEHFILHLLIQIGKKQYMPSGADNLIIWNILDIVNYELDGSPLSRSTYSNALFQKIYDDNNMVLNILIEYYKSIDDNSLKNYLSPFIKILYVVEQKLKASLTSVPTNQPVDIVKHIEQITSIIGDKKKFVIPHSNKNILAIIDTETGDELAKNDTLVSIGVVIVDENLNILDSYYSNVINNAKFIMYGSMLNMAEIPPKSLDMVRSETSDLLKKYNVDTLMAYNASFDRRVLTNAEFPIISNWSDIMKVARNVKYNTNIPKESVTYKTGSLKKGYGVDEMLEHITDISEAHNALTDAYDELLILVDLCKSTSLDNILKFGTLKK